MNENTRNRLLWTMTALVVVYAIVNVAIYYNSGTFGRAWFVASLAVYGLVLLGAIALLLFGGTKAPAQAPDAKANPRAATAAPPATPTPAPAPEAAAVKVTVKTNEPARGDTQA